MLCLLYQTRAPEGRTPPSGKSCTLQPYNMPQQRAKCIRPLSDGLEGFNIRAHAPLPCLPAQQTPTHIYLGQGLEDIVPLFAALEAACKGISMLVQRAAIAGATGAATGGGQNAGGDHQKKLDVVSNDLLKGFLARSGVVRVLASEEVVFVCEFVYSPSLVGACLRALTIFLRRVVRSNDFSGLHYVRCCSSDESSFSKSVRNFFFRGSDPPDRGPNLYRRHAGAILHFVGQLHLDRNVSHEEQHADTFLTRY